MFSLNAPFELDSYTTALLYSQPALNPNSTNTNSAKQAHSILSAPDLSADFVNKLSQQTRRRPGFSPQPHLQADPTLQAILHEKIDTNNLPLGNNSAPPSMPFLSYSAPNTNIYSFVALGRSAPMNLQSSDMLSYLFQEDLMTERDYQQEQEQQFQQQQQQLHQQQNDFNFSSSRSTNSRMNQDEMDMYAQMNNNTQIRRQRDSLGREGLGDQRNQQQHNMSQFPSNSHVSHEKSRINTNNTRQSPPSIKQQRGFRQQQGQMRGDGEIQEKTVVHFPGSQTPLRSNSNRESTVINGINPPTGSDGCSITASRSTARKGMRMFGEETSSTKPSQINSILSQNHQNDRNESNSGVINNRSQMDQVVANNGHSSSGSSGQNGQNGHTFPSTQQSAQNNSMNLSSTSTNFSFGLFSDDDSDGAFASPSFAKQPQTGCQNVLKNGQNGPQNSSPDSPLKRKRPAEFEGNSGMRDDYDGDYGGNGDQSQGSYHENDHNGRNDQKYSQNDNNHDTTTQGSDLSFNLTFNSNVATPPKPAKSAPKSATQSTNSTPSKPGQKNQSKSSIGVKGDGSGGNIPQSVGRDGRSDGASGTTATTNHTSAKTSSAGATATTKSTLKSSIPATPTSTSRRGATTATTSTPATPIPSASSSSMGMRPGQITSPRTNTTTSSSHFTSPSTPRTVPNSSASSTARVNTVNPSSTPRSNVSTINSPRMPTNTASNTATTSSSSFSSRTAATTLTSPRLTGTSATTSTQRVTRSGLGLSATAPSTMGSLTSPRGTSATTAATITSPRAAKPSLAEAMAIGSTPKSKATVGKTKGEESQVKQNKAQQQKEQQKVQEKTKTPAKIQSDNSIDDLDSDAHNDTDLFDLSFGFSLGSNTTPPKGKNDLNNASKTQGTANNAKNQPNLSANQNSFNSINSLSNNPSNSSTASLTGFKANSSLSNQPNNNNNIPPVNQAKRLQKGHHSTQLLDSESEFEIDNNSLFNNTIQTPTNPTKQSKASSKATPKDSGMIRSDIGTRMSARINMATPMSPKTLHYNKGHNVGSFNSDDDNGNSSDVDIFGLFDDEYDNNQSSKDESTMRDQTPPKTSAKQSLKHEPQNTSTKKIKNSDNRHSLSTNKKTSSSRIIQSTVEELMTTDDDEIATLAINTRHGAQKKKQTDLNGSANSNKNSRKNGKTYQNSTDDDDGTPNFSLPPTRTTRSQSRAQNGTNDDDITAATTTSMRTPIKRPARAPAAGSTIGKPKRNNEQ